MSIKSFVLSLLLATFAGTTSASGVTVSPGYLEGAWVMGEKQNCKSADAHYLIIRKNGTIEMGQGGSAKIVGFWEQNNDDLTLHMLMSPEISTEKNPFYRSSYRYQYVKAKIVEANPDAFGAIVDTNVDAGIQTLSRCP